ncbi:MAG: DUF547 domain-containing protein [Candidatus Bipolaricaulia bacterium]
MTMNKSDEQRQGFDHQLFTKVLQEFVDDHGCVNYAALKTNSEQFDHYLEQLAEASPESHPERFPAPEDQLAYWINAYNAFVIAGVLEKYPIRSVLFVDFGRFFKRHRYVAGGKRYSLDEIEHQILRARFDEARVHFVLNCGAGSCPMLPHQAYEPHQLKQRLDEATHQFLSQDQNLRIDHERRTIYLSRILTRYAEDFAREEEADNEKVAVIRFVAHYLGIDPQEIRDYRIKPLRYSWWLNDCSDDDGSGSPAPGEAVEIGR